MYRTCPWLLLLLLLCLVSADGRVGATPSSALWSDRQSPESLSIVSSAVLLGGPGAQDGNDSWLPLLRLDGFFDAVTLAEEPALLAHTANAPLKSCVQHYGFAASTLVHAELGTLPIQTLTARNKVYLSGFGIENPLLDLVDIDGERSDNRTCPVAAISPLVSWAPASRHSLYTVQLSNGEQLICGADQLFFAKRILRVSTSSLDEISPASPLHTIMGVD